MNQEPERYNPFLQNYFYIHMILSAIMVSMVEWRPDEEAKAALAHLAASMFLFQWRMSSRLMEWLETTNSGGIYSLFVRKLSNLKGCLT